MFNMLYQYLIYFNIAAEIGICAPHLTSLEKYFKSTVANKLLSNYVFLFGAGQVV